MLTFLIISLFFGPIFFQYVAFAFLAVGACSQSFFQRSKSLGFFLLGLWGTQILLWVPFQGTCWGNVLSGFGCILGILLTWKFFFPCSFPFFSKSFSLKAYVGFVGAMVIYALVQFLTGWDVRREGMRLADSQIPGDNIYRIQLFTGHPNTVSDIHSLLSLIFLHFAFLAKGSRRKCFALASGLHFFLVVLSWTRIPLLLLLGFFFGVLFLRLRKLRGILLMLPLFLFFLFLKSHRFQELFLWIKDPQLFLQTDKRPYFWWVHFQIFLQSPWWGSACSFFADPVFLRNQYAQMGFAWIPEQTHFFMAHNVILELLARQGVLGLFFWMLMGLVVLVWCRLLDPFLWVLIGFLFLHGLIQNTFFDSSVMLVGLGLVLLLVLGWPFEEQEII